MLFVLHILGAYCSGLPSECQKPGIIVLTIEEGPTGYTDTILDILEENKIAGAFHFNTNSKGLEDVIQRAYDDGHDVGLRTSPKRDYFAIEDKSAIESDLQNQIDYIEKIIGTKIHFARSPSDGADVNQDVYQYFTENKIIQTSYAYSPYDNQENSPSDNLQEWLESSNPQFDSYIISLYDQMLGEDDELQKIIDVCKKKGYKFAPLSECLEDYQPGTLTSSGYSDFTKSKSGVPTFVSSGFVTLVTYLFL